MKKTLLCVAFIFLGLSTIQAQKGANLCTITGKIVDEIDSENGIPYATIRFFDHQKKLIKTAASLQNGRFEVSLPSDKSYQIKVTSVGFGEAAMNIVLNKEDRRYSCGSIMLKESKVMLKEVVVSEQRPLIKTEADKLIYNIEADPSNKGNMMLETLRNVPMLEIDPDDNIKLNGESNFKVLVDGKENPMMNKNLKEVLRSMPSDAVKEIEVITNPSTKYDAEGVGGVINIITHKKALSGFLGSVNAAYRSISGSVSGSAYLQSKTGKFDYSVNYWTGISTNPYVTESEGKSINKNSESLHQMFNRSTNLRSYSNHSLNFQGSYEIDTLNLLTASVGIDLPNSTSSINQTYLGLHQNNDTTLYYSSENRSESYSFSSSFSLDYQRSFKKKDQTLTLSYKFYFDPEQGNTNTSYFNTFNYSVPNRKMNNRREYNANAFQADYFDPLSKNHQIEGGMKYQLLNNSNENEALIERNSNWVVDPGRQNDISYLQHIIGLYGGYLYKNDLLTAKGGFRVEGTINDGRFFNNNAEMPFYKSYFNVVPYLNYSMKIGELNRLTISYTQRLRRPGINHLNPYINDTDPMNIRRGNSELESELSHTLNMRYGISFEKVNLNLSAFGSLLNNGIETISVVNSSGVRESFPGNFGKRRNVSLNLNASVRSIKNVTISASINGRYMNNLNTFDGVSNNGLSYSANINAYATLWKDGSINAFGYYQSGASYFMKSYSDQYAFGVGVGQQFFKRKLRVNVGVQNPFRPYFNYFQIEEGATFRSENNFSFTAQAFTISIGYSFGKLNSEVKKAKRGIVEDNPGGGGGESGAPMPRQ